jgi:hypothetical protein
MTDWALPARVTPQTRRVVHGQAESLPSRTAQAHFGMV